MRKLIFIFIFFTSIDSNAQIAFQNLAVRKPFLTDSLTFKYTGALQKFTVPNKVTSIQVKAVGAKGGTGGRGQVGGAGANITTTLNVTPGQVLYIVVGGFPGQSATAKYGYGGNGGSSVVSSYGGAGGGLSGVFTSSTPANANALVVAGGGGGGAGITTGTDYTGGAAANTSAGTASNGNEGTTNYLVSGRYQYGYGATLSAVGVGGNAFDVVTGTAASNGNDISGGAGGSDGGVNTWNGGGGGGGGYFGGGSGAGGGGATGGGAGGSTKSTSGISSFGLMNNTGDGSVIITCFSNSGLVFNLDAGNTSSYSGTGNTWNDLSTNASNVTTTSTTYNSSNGGNISFDGSSSYADFTANIGNTNVVTVEMWVKTNSLKTPGGAMYFGFGLYDAWTSGGNIGFNSAAGDLYGISSTQVNYLGIVGYWKHLVFVMNSGTLTNNKIYVDGVSQSLTQLLGTFNASNATFNAGAGRIASWRNDLGWLMNIQVSNFKIYKRELTQQEITNNYNAYRAKFYAENDGLSPSTASTSAYQIKKDYPNSTDGFYWIKNANINGGVPTKIYADMTTSGGGWTLIMKNSSNSVWTYANAIAYNTKIPFTVTADVTSTSTASYSIIGWADYIKQSTSGFQYMIDAGSRGNYGGIWTANGNYSFVNTDNTQTNVTLNTMFGNWSYVGSNNGMQQRMPWYSSTAGSGTGFITLSSGTANWWGTLLSNNSYYSPSPWISDAGTGGTPNQNPGIIWYWVR